MTAPSLDKNYELWINDKCPTDLDEVIGNSFFIKTIKKCIENNKLPNLLLTGGQGVGKKMIAKLIAKKYGGDVKVIDATINKSKDIVVVNIKNTDPSECINITSFAKAKNRIEFGCKKKIIIITNFDEMTSEAQNALRSILETYSSTTRFIITSNNVNNIIEPLQSRFNTFIIKKLSNKNINKLISNISPKLSSDISDLIIMISDGDIKQIINYMQLISCYDDITISDFIKIFKIPSIHIIKKLIKELFSNKNPYETMKLVNILLNKYDPHLLCLIVSKTLITYYEQDKYGINLNAIYISNKLSIKGLHPIVHFITLINKLIINSIYDKDQIKMFK